MKLVLKNTDNLVNQRLHIAKKEIPCLDSSWHYHSQFELIYISKSDGIRFVGDSVSPFLPGDLVLVGPYLPHLWLNNASFQLESQVKKVNTIVIKFTEDFMGEGTFKNSEFSEIGKMLEKSKYGIHFGESISKKMHNELIVINSLSPAEKSIKLIDILYRLSLTNEQVVLSSTDMRQYSTENSERIDTVLKYISDNYASNINLNNIAEVACMTTNSFCRFFKRATNKSFTQFLNEVRIKNASRMLIQEKYNVSEVCYVVGYNSITNFNKQFKQIMGTSPKNYREKI